MGGYCMLYLLLGGDSLQSTVRVVACYLKDRVTLKVCRHILHAGDKRAVKQKNKMIVNIAINLFLVDEMHQGIFF